MISRIIVESLNGKCVVNIPLDREYTEEEVRKVLEDDNKLPILSLDVDLVGTALVIIIGNLY